jgi:eukaryotic-like serine/threonine-protein kinase
MRLSAGDRLGPYEILSPIGAGGMGEVFRGRDTRLKRDVALKILPEAFARDPERLARFQREAQMLAALNHPNIAQIHGMEDSMLVMELVEGQCPRGPMEFDRAWNIAMQIADGLEYAHDKGIVHRDLKPANVKVTPEGVVKLLDFGLAKAFEDQGDAQGRDVSVSSTLTMDPTKAGVILGTPAYLSPEQANGQRVDQRADIWSWGVVLYELLTGERLFKGSSVADTLARVLTTEPDVKRVPAQVQRLLRRCLEKDPKRRLRHIGDARYLADVGTEVPLQSNAGHTRLPWALAAIGLAAAIVFTLLYFRQPPPADPFLKYTIAAPEGAKRIHSFAISPDGRLIVMSAEGNDGRRLWLRALDGLQARAMSFTEDATFPFWSPDSRSIGFFAQGKLKTISTDGGPARSVCDAPDGRGASWNRQGTIVFAPLGVGGAALQRVAAVGGIPVDVIRRKGTSRFPAFLPDGNHFLYLVALESREENGIHLASLDGKKSRRLLPDISSAVFSAGRVLFIRENTMMAQHLEITNGRFVGEAVLVAEGVSLTANGTYAPITVSDNGRLLYQSDEHASGDNQLSWHDRQGKLLGSVVATGPVHDPAIAPDEKSVAFRRGSISSADLWLRDLTRGTNQRFTMDGSGPTTPVWSPNGDRIAFCSTHGAGRFNLYEKSSGGIGPEQLLLATESDKVLTQWSRDSRFLVYSELNLKTKWDVSLLPMDAATARNPIPFLHSEFDEIHGQLSPDGHWMAYTSDESGRREVYVRPFPATDFQWRISLAGGGQPRWRSDGEELFFVGANGSIMVVEVKAVPGTKPSFRSGAPQPLFETHLAQSPGDIQFQYDVSADGKRFLLDSVRLRIGGGASEPFLIVVMNWNAQIKN